MAISARPIPLGIGSYNGLSWGPGQAVQVIDSDGDETPSMRTNDQDRTGAHGTWTSRDWFTGRTVTVTFAVFAADPISLRQLLTSIEQAWLPDSTERALWLYNSTRFLNARIRRRHFDHTVGGLGSAARVTVQFYARDPIYYGPAASVQINPAVISGGMSWPMSWPLAWGSVVTGSAVVTNSGTVETSPIITIPGPVTNPAVTNDTLAATLRVNLVLAAGDVLTINPDVRTVVINNGPSRIANLDPASIWWKLQPGANSIRFSSGSGAPTEYATLVYSPAWP